MHKVLLIRYNSTAKGRIVVSFDDVESGIDGAHISNSFRLGFEISAFCMESS